MGFRSVDQAEIRTMKNNRESIVMALDL
jgi:hypothetical protein